MTTPPPPWRWMSVQLGPAGGETAPTSRGRVLVASDGTVLALAGDYLRLPDVDAGVLELLSRAWVLQDVPELTELWTWFVGATTPVDTANATLQFANAFFHFTEDASGALEEFEHQEGVVGAVPRIVEAPGAMLPALVARLLGELEDASRRANSTEASEPVERALATAELLRDLVVGRHEE